MPHIAAAWPRPLPSQGTPPLKRAPHPPAPARARRTHDGPGLRPTPGRPGELLLCWPHWENPTTREQATTESAVRPACAALHASAIIVERDRATAEPPSSQMICKKHKYTHSEHSRAGRLVPTCPSTQPALSSLPALRRGYPNQTRERTVGCKEGMQRKPQGSAGAKQERKPPHLSHEASSSDMAAILGRKLTRQPRAPSRGPLPAHTCSCRPGPPSVPLPSPFTGPPGLSPLLHTNWAAMKARDMAARITRDILGQGHQLEVGHHVGCDRADAAAQ